MLTAGLRAGFTISSSDPCVVRVRYPHARFIGYTLTGVAAMVTTAVIEQRETTAGGGRGDGNVFVYHIIIFHACDSSCAGVVRVVTEDSTEAYIPALHTYLLVGIGLIVFGMLRLGPAM